MFVCSFVSLFLCLFSSAWLCFALLLVWFGFGFGLVRFGLVPDGSVFDLIVLFEFGFRCMCRVLFLFVFRSMFDP